ncbi:hypothetical protein KKI24_24365 [bacterium]|nr:hypothetical protein [bacterium]
MSELRNLIKKSKTAKKELVATTVRIPKELHSFIEELADYLAVSKHEAIIKLIEEGITVAEDELKLGEVEENRDCKFHILNTNKRHSLDDHQKMLTEGIAAAFYNPWKFNIDRIQKGDVIFLYENGKGIVAYGKATGITKMADQNNDKDECHYQELEAFTKLEKPLTASEIKKILGRNVVFLRTMSGMPDGQKVLEIIEKHIK